MCEFADCASSKYFKSFLDTRRLLAYVSYGKCTYNLVLEKEDSLPHLCHSGNIHVCSTCAVGSEVQLDTNSQSSTVSAMEEINLRTDKLQLKYMGLWCSVITNKAQILNQTGLTQKQD